MREIPSLQNEANNSHCEFSVGMIKNSDGGIVPRVVRRHIFYFLSRDGHTGICEVIGTTTMVGIIWMLKSSELTESMIVRVILIE